MPVIINPFQGTDPTAQAFSDVGNAIFGNTGEAALRQQQIIDAQRKNTEIMNLGQRIKTLGMNAVATDPTAQAETVESGYDPANLGKLGLMGSAVAAGAAAPATQNWQVGSGESFDNTADATAAKLANASQIAGMEPVAAINTTTGLPAFGTKATVAAPGSTFAPVITDSDERGLQIGNNWNNLGALNPTQKAAIGASGPAPSQVQTYLTPTGTLRSGTNTASGIMDPTDGSLLPPGSHPVGVQGNQGDVGATTNAVKTDIEKGQIALNNFMGLSTAMIGLANNHPEAFGGYGKVAGGVQELAQSANVLINAMGGGPAYAKMLGNARDALAAGGASPDILSQFNPAITAVDTLGPVLAASAANAIAGQTGRSLSDQDYKLFLGVVGDPQGWLSSATGTATRLKILQAAVTYSGQLAQQYLSQGKVVPDGIAAEGLAKAVGDVANNKSDLISGAGTASAPPAAAPAAPPPAPPVPLAPLPTAPAAAPAGPPAVAPAATTPPPGTPSATNPKTGQKVYFVNGQWQ